VLDNSKINEVYWKITLKTKRIARLSRPGHFVNIRITQTSEPLLRRPFSVYRTQKDRLEVLYDVVGKGTGLLSRLKKGDEVDVLGPLGNGFSRPKKKEVSILIGGGIGVAPLVCWDETFGADFFLMGHKTAGQVLPKTELKGRRGKKFVATDDGSAGKKGLVTDLLRSLLEKEKGRSCRLYTCGPDVMMREVRKIAKRKGLPGELSTEETMACGIGACLGCMVKTKQGYVASCKEGPVFDFEELE
jgi:dihydroorotate dehydrogenase electron transfer subunit